MLEILARKSNTVGQTTPSHIHPSGPLMPKQHNSATPLKSLERPANLPHPHPFAPAAPLPSPTPPRPLPDVPDPHPPSVPSGAV
jgi:hypothetical protein